MSKRKINQQQARRIQASQAKKLARALDPEDEQLGTEQTGLLIARYGKQLEVEAEDGEIYQCHSRQNLFDLVVGDSVIWQQKSANTGVIVACLPRTNLLARTNYKQQPKPIAANIDQILLILAPEPTPTTLLIDSYLVAIAQTKIPVVIVVNKVDLLNQQKPELIELLTNYQNLGYQVVMASALTETGFITFKNLLTNKTNILVGQSGVGKSSLIAKLLPETDIAVGKLAGHTKLGAHTTSASRLYHLAEGGNIIDSPGIREFALGTLTPEQIAYGFIEFKPFLGHCRFHNCQHLQEPDCALQAAVNNKQIPAGRFANYQKLVSKPA